MIFTIKHPQLRMLKDLDCVILLLSDSVRRRWVQFSKYSLFPHYAWIMIVKYLRSVIGVIFFKKFLEDIISFCGATDTPVLDFWWCLLWVSKPEWTASFTLGQGICNVCSLIPADLLVANMAAEPFSSMYLQTNIGGAWNWDLSWQDRRSTDWAMPTRLSLV